MALRSKEVTANLASGAIDALFAFEDACELVTVYVHFSTPITEEIRISYKSAAGTAYDTLIADETLQGKQDYVYAAAGEVAFNIGDKVRVQITNANGTGVAGISVKARN